MTWNCLLIDLTGNAALRLEQSNALGRPFAIPLNIVGGIEEADIIMNTGTVGAMVVFSNQFDLDLETILRNFQEKVGCIPESQLIIIDDPAPRFIVSVFEFGIEQFASQDSWPAEVEDLCVRVNLALEDKESTEAKSLALSGAIRTGDQGKINELAADFEELSSSDYRAAYARGRAMEAAGQYNDALGEFSVASKLNKMFRPSETNRGQTLLLTGRTDEAIEVFQKLDRSNPRDLNRKASLAAAFIEKGDIEVAMRYVTEGEALSPAHPRLIETRAHIFLSTSKLAEAFQLMDQMSDIGPFFSAKLNELGIRLSQAGKGKTALALYQKAHKIVRSELKYKISLNAALACRRLEENEMALKYIGRCRKEYGGSFEKLDKIESSVKAAIMKKVSESKKVG
jgi:tetratricopeptide (TPR) repeat protein